MSKLTKRLALGRTALALIVVLSGCAGTEGATEPGDTADVSTVRVMPETAGLAIGRTLQLTADVRDTRGRAMPDEAVTWTSSDPTIATVDDAGTVAALREGEVEIRGRARGKQGRSTVTVSPTPVATVVVSPTSLALTVGAQSQLTATTLSSTDSVLTGRPVVWASSNTGVATVDSVGRVTARAAGTAAITATSEERIGSASVNVTSTPVGAVTTLAVASATDGGVTLRFTEISDGTGAPANYAVRFATPTITWSSATAVNNGTCSTPITGTSVGAVRSCTVLGLTAGTTYQFQMVAFRGAIGSTAVYGPLSNIVSATTGATAVASIALTPATASAVLGGTASFSATLRDAAGNVLTGRTVTWSSSNTSVATVSGSGVATAVSAGTATIRATSGGVTGTATLTVTAPSVPVASVTVGPASATTATGDGIQFTATLRDANGNVLSGRAVTWTSSSVGVATVGSSGAAMGVSGGTVTIRATSEGVSGQATLTVTEPLSVSPVFESSWSATTGNTTQAVTDGGRWPVLACGTTFSQVLTVVGGSSVGWTETANVLRLQQRGPNACGMLQRNDVVPASTTHWGRFYIRNDENGNSGDHPTGYNNAHWSGGAIQAVPLARESSSHVTAGTWRISVGGGASYPFRKWWGPALQNGRWYRYEWEMRFVSATRYQFWPRVYNEAGVLVADADDFVQEDYPGAGQQTLAGWFAAGNAGTVQDPALARHFGIGHEGTTGDATLGYWYYARFAMSTSGWLGR